MGRAQGRDARYARILAIGMGVSLAFHVALFGLVRLRTTSTATRALTSLTLTVDESTTEPPERSEKLQPAKERLAGSASSQLAEWRPRAVAEPTAPDRSALPDLSEAAAVARLAATRVIPPLVPRPRIVPATTEQGLTPVSVAPPTWMLADGRAKSGSSGGGIRIRFGSGGKCGPHLPALPNY
jgi:hypothetical protein